MKKYLTLLATVSLSALLLFSTFGDMSLEPCNVILISWDGVQREHFHDMIEKGDLPNVSYLLREGGIADISITDHVTDTKSGHAQMLTGYPPSVSRVYNNRQFKPIPPGFTIFEQLEDYSSGEIVTIMLTGKTHHLGGERGEPFFITRRSLDVFDSNKAHADVVGPKALYYLEKYKNNQILAFFHFSDPDCAGHRYGENSPEYEEAIRTCDEWLGKIMTFLKENDLYGRTILYVTSDHGFDEGKTTHYRAPFVFIVSNKKVASGDQKDIVPTILSDFGINPAEVDPPLPGRDLSYL